MLRMSAPESRRSLVLIPHHEEVPVALGQEFDQNVLDMVRILILINQDVAPAPLVLFQDIGVLLEELHGVSQQIVEVEGPVGQELFLITGIHRRDGLGPEAIGLLPILFRINQFVLGAADGLEDEPWLIALLIEIQFPQTLPDYPQLIGRIVDEEIARESQVLCFPAEDPNANGVESPDPKILYIPTSSSTRRFISPAALLVKVTARISQGAVPVANR